MAGISREIRHSDNWSLGRFSREIQVSGIPQPAQDASPLALKQIEDLIKIPTPDVVVEREIKARGIAFKLDDVTLESLKKLGAGPKTILALSSLLPRPTPTPTPPTRCAGGSSAEVIRKAWEALHANKFDDALVCAQTVVNKWGNEATKQQALRQRSGKCKDKPTPEERQEFNHKFFALNDVATALLIRGRALSNQEQFAPARDAYNRVLREYECAFYWDGKAKKGEGLFISVANVAERRLNEIKSK